MLNGNQLSELRKAALQALTCEEKTGVPCELTLAQWALESGWGSHQPGNNCFGIKGDTKSGQLLGTTEWFGAGGVDRWLMAKQGRTALLLDGEPPRANGSRKYACKDWFALYSSLADCFIDHARLFEKGMYANFMGTYKIDNNLVNLVNNVASLYATDPNYSREVLAIMSMPEVQASIIEAKRG